MDRVLRLVLPYPPSANSYWRPARLGNGKMTIVPTTEAKAYKGLVRQLASGAKPLLGPVVLEFIAYRPRRVGDLDNLLKVTLDALKGIAFEDDSQVVEIRAYRRDDRSNPRIDLELVGQEPEQGSLLERAQGQAGYQVTPAVFRPGGVR